MIGRSFFSHRIPPDGHSVFDVLSADGYCFTLAGENIGWNNYSDEQSTTAIERMFMESPSHRDDILGARWERIGIGAFKGHDGRKMWTVLFADPCAAGHSTEVAGGARFVPAVAPTARPTAPGSAAKGSQAGRTGDLAPGSGSSGTLAVLRVVDRGRASGVADLIVGDVTGRLFGR